MAELVDRSESFSFCISDLSRGGKKATLVEHVRKFWKNYRQLWSWILYPSSENFPNDLCKKWCTEGEHLFEKGVVKEREREREGEIERKGDDLKVERLIEREIQGEEETET